MFPHFATEEQLTLPKQSLEDDELQSVNRVLAKNSHLKLKNSTHWQVGQKGSVWSKVDEAMHSGTKQYPPPPLPSQS